MAASSASQSARSPSATSEASAAVGPAFSAEPVRFRRWACSRTPHPEADALHDAADQHFQARILHKPQASHGLRDDGLAG